MISLGIIWQHICEKYNVASQHQLDCDADITTRNALFSRVSDSYPAMINHTDIDFRKNTDPFHTAFQLAYNTDVAYFGAGGWLTKDPQEAVKFGLACVLWHLCVTWTN
jgi:hypothetical protein